MSITEIQPNLSNLQMELLKLYANGVQDEDLQEIKHMLSKYFLKKQLTKLQKLQMKKNTTKQISITG